MSHHAFSRLLTAYASTSSDCRCALATQPRRCGVVFCFARTGMGAVSSAQFVGSHEALCAGSADFGGSLLLQTLFVGAFVGSAAGRPRVAALQYAVLPKFVT